MTHNIVFLHTTTDPNPGRLYSESRWAKAKAAHYSHMIQVAGSEYCFKPFSKLLNTLIFDYGHRKLSANFYALSFKPLISKCSSIDD